MRDNDVTGVSIARIASLYGAREDVGAVGGGGPLVARSWGVTVAGTGTFVVAASEVGVAALSLD